MDHDIVPRYYECHVTIEPVFDHDLERVSAITKEFGFKVADLFMQKDRTEKAERSNKDTFCTGHSSDYATLYARMNDLQKALNSDGYIVFRKKIEAVLFDQRY